MEKNQKALQEVREYMLEKLDQLGIDGKQIPALTNDQLLQTIEVVNQLLGILEYKSKEFLDLDLESQLAGIELEVDKQRLESISTGCKAELRRRLAGANPEK